MSESTTITRRAHAKINLALSVGPPLADTGYHPIASWMAPIELHDTLIVRRLPDGSPSRHTVSWSADAPRPSPIDWPIESDLAVRAHRCLEQTVGRPLPVELSLEKRTPVGGGLGGGSSDAAEMLIAVNALFGLGLDIATLAGIGATIGSDVPFFVDERPGESVSPGLPPDPPRSAIVTGLGDRIERTATPRQELILLLPPFGCPTGPVYRAYDELGAKKLREPDVRALARKAAQTGWIPVFDLFNDLAEPARRVEPRLARIHKQIASNYLVPVHITGSGSTMFIAYHHDKPPDALTFYEETVKAIDADVAVVRTRIV